MFPWIHLRSRLGSTPAKMARQFLGRPRGVFGWRQAHRFSKAGKLYGDDKKAQEDGSLEHALFAAANTE